MMKLCENGRIRIFPVLFAAVLFFTASSVWSQVTVDTSFALHGQPKYREGFTHFDYTNPRAPKGGTLKLFDLGSYDNFHRYAQRGVAAERSGSLYDTLMAGSDDEADVVYPLIAEMIEYPADYSWVIFHINPNARFHDGVPITAETVVFSFNTFFEKGVPQFRQYYSNVESVKALDRYRVQYTLKEGDKEMILSLAGSIVIPKHFWETRNFSDPLTEPPVGSGPYRVSDYKIGQYVVYERVRDYWAKDLPVNKGRFNFDTIRYDSYRDRDVAFEAFKAGEFDFWNENEAKRWATQHKGPRYDSGAIVKEEIPHNIPQGMQSLVFNTQRSVFSDRRVREALVYALDFEWMNRNLFYNQYTRTRSYFQNTEYEAKGLPSREERRILEPIRDQIPPEVFTKEFQPPVTDGSGNIRRQMRIALGLLKQAGWEIRDRQLVNVRTGQPMEFELLIYSPSAERIAIPIKKNLERMGITMNIRMVDTTQYTFRMRERDFDMIDRGYDAMIYPSTDLKIIFHSDYMDFSYNLAGIRDEAVDYLVEGIAERQEDSDALLYWGRALDRVLTWNHYVIPEWHLSKHRVAYSRKLARPSTLPRYSLGFDSWWIE